MVFADGDEGLSGKGREGGEGGGGDGPGLPEPAHVACYVAWDSEI